MLRFALTLASLFAIGSASAPAKAQGGHAQLVSLFADWREFSHPKIVDGRPDYSAKAMTAKAARLPDFQTRLKAIDPAGWTASDAAITATSRPR